MAVERLWQSGFELENNSLDAGVDVTFTGAMSYDPVIVRTGLQSLEMGTDRYDFYYDIGSGNGITQARINAQFYYAGGTGGLGEPELFYFRKGVNELIRLKYVLSSDQWVVWAGTGTTEIASSAIAMDDGNWNRICIDVKIHNTVGWVYVYLNGIEIISYDGQTDQGDTDIEDFGVGPITGTRRWGTDERVDDVTIENTEGEVAPADMGDIRYYYLPATGAGSYTEFTPLSGNNWDNCDEIPPDSDTTYNETNVDANRDSYSVEDYAVPAGRKVQAFIPLVVARKPSALDPTLIRNFTHLDPDTDDDVAGQAMDSTYEMFWYRTTTAPDGGLIYQSTVNNIEAGAQAIVPI